MTAIEAVFDSCTLGQPEIAALADDFAAQFIGIDPDIVIAFIADIGMAFGTGFHIGANAAIPEQIRIHLENQANQFERPHGRFFGIEELAGLGAEFDFLGLPRVNATTFGD